MLSRLRRHNLTALVLLVIIGLAATAAAQRRRGGFGGGFYMRPPANPPYDGMFQFCRIMFRQNPNGDGGGWSVDYPKADINFPYRLSELTATRVSKDANGNPNHAVFLLTDDELYKCPFIMMTEVGALYMDDMEAARLRDYLLKGGFLWADDFWGEYAWQVWQSQISKSLPEYQSVDIPLAHPLFHMLYQVNAGPADSVDQFVVRPRRQHVRARRRERDAARARDLRRARQPDGAGTHNTDFGDAFEREGENRAYFDEFAGVGYAFGINALLYAMSH